MRAFSDLALTCYKIPQTSDLRSIIVDAFVRPAGNFVSTDLKIYAAVVEGYTKRSLTYHPDALPAISGVFRTFESSLGRFVSEMPVEFLEKVLLWMPSPRGRSILSSDVTAPSWSWAR